MVGAAASKEAALEKALAKMQADWDGMDFRVVEYKDTGTFVIGGTDEVQVRWAGVTVARQCGRHVMPVLVQHLLVLLGQASARPVQLPMC